MKLSEILIEATRRDFLKGMGAAAVTGMAGNAEARDKEGFTLTVDLPFKEALDRIQDGIPRHYHHRTLVGISYAVIPTIREDKARFEIFFVHLGKDRPHSIMYVYDRGEQTEIKVEDAPDRPKRFMIGKHISKLEKMVNEWLAAEVADDF